LENGHSVEFSGMLRCMGGYVVPNVSKDHSAFIFRIMLFLPLNTA